MVKDLRKIHYQIRNKIKDMTFAEERAYLDKLLAEKEKPVSNKILLQVGQNIKSIGFSLISAVIFVKE